MPKEILKKSKSAEQISLTPPVPIERSKSVEPFSDPKYPYTTLISQTQELEALRKESAAKSTTIALLRKKIGELEQSSTTNSELDQALVKRHQNLKDWFKQYEKSQNLDKELRENIEEASTELINQDQTISKLRGERSQLQEQLSTLKLQKQSLTKDLELAQRAVQWRSSSPSWPSTSNSWMIYALTFCLVGSLLWLIR